MIVMFVFALLELLTESREKIPAHMYEGTRMVEATNEGFQRLFRAFLECDGCVNIREPVSSFLFSEIETEASGIN